MPLMELEDTEDSTSSDGSEESESEFSESIGDIEDDDDNDDDDDDVSCSGYTTESDSCGSNFLDGIEQDFLESFQRSKTENALVREEVVKKRASLSALDMLQQAAKATDELEGGDRDSSHGPKARQLARANSMKNIMDRMQNSTTFYFQAPTKLRRCSSDPIIMRGSDLDDDDDDDSASMANTAVVIENAPAALTSSGGKKVQDSSSQLPRRKSRRSSTFPKGAATEEMNTILKTTTMPTMIDYGKSPEDCLKEILDGITYRPTSDDYFLKIDAARLSRYSAEVAKAVRAQDIDKLRKLHEEDGICFDACNSQGESLVHLACRRRNLDLLRFLVKESNVSLKVRDDWGKSPLHELCWNGQPSKAGGSSEFFPAVKLVLEQEPELLFAKDKRGFCPCQYVPKDHWKEWCKFLKTNKRLIRFKVQYIGFARSRDQLRKTLELAQAALIEYSSQ